MSTRTRAWSLTATVLVFGAAACRSSAPTDIVTPTPQPPASVAPAADESFRATPPEAEGEVVFQPPKIEETRLANGLRVLVVTRHELPIVSVTLAVRRGVDQSPPGVGAFSAALLTQGTKDLTSLQVSDAVKGLGATLSSFASFDATMVSGRCLSNRLDPFMDLLGAVVKTPRFDKEEIERERISRLTAIGQQSDQPSTIAWNTTTSVLYPKGHPYASPTIGDEASVKNASRAALQQAYAASMGPEDAVVAFAGDVTLDQAKQEAERVLGDWKGHQKKRDTRVDVAPPAIMKSTESAVPRLVFVERPGATQSQVLYARVGVPRKGPDFDALTVMNTILGGHFSSRLNMNLREKHAYTYGARSGFDMRIGPGPFTAGGAIETRATAPAIKEMRSELARIRKEDVSDEELATAKKFQNGQLPARFESASDTSATLAALAVYDLGNDEFATRAARVQAVTAADVRRVAARYLDDADAWIVVVGDPSVLPELEGLGLGKPEIRKAPAKKPAPKPGAKAPAPKL